MAAYWHGDSTSQETVLSLLLLLLVIIVLLYQWLLELRAFFPAPWIIHRMILFHSITTNSSTRQTKQVTGKEKSDFGLTTVKQYWLVKEVVIMHWACTKITASLAINDGSLLEILLDKVPLLLSIGEEDTALVKATESGDTDLVYLVLFHIWQKKPPLEFFGMIQARPLPATYS